MQVEWQWSAYEELSRDDLYAILARRQEVFVIEQQCIYADLDGIDAQAFHLLGWGKVEGRRELLAYLRCVHPGVKYAEASLGRVLSAPSARGTGIGRAMMAEALRHTDSVYPGQAIRISAQLYLEKFYASFGFVSTSAPYDEDGIPHIEMLRM
ncbi:MAG TPA: GNAT family N-acetyltransferase [Burkholderiaceae bacterium]